jgi:hypothetical protein
VNILRHQATKNGGNIDEEDLVLCLQIVSRLKGQNKAIATEVKQFYTTLLNMQIGEQVRNPKKVKNQVSFHQLLGPLIVKSSIAVLKTQTSKCINQAFESFKLQFGSKVVKYSEFTEFVQATVKYMQGEGLYPYLS